MLWHRVLFGMLWHRVLLRVFRLVCRWSNRISLHHFPFWRLVLEVIIVGMLDRVNVLDRLDVVNLAVVMSSRESLGPSLRVGDCSSLLAHSSGHHLASLSHLE